MQRFSNLFFSVRCSTCFRRFFRPSSGAQNCTYSVRHLSDCYLLRHMSYRYCYLLLAWLGCSITSRLAAGSSNGLTYAWRCMCSFVLLMMGRKTRLKHVQHPTEMNKLEIQCILLVVLWESIAVILLLNKMNCKTEANTDCIQNGKFQVLAVFYLCT